MNKIIAFASTLFFLVICGLGYSSDDTEDRIHPCNCPENGAQFVSCPKTYVTPEQIDFHENRIFVQINDLIVQTKSLLTDTQGIYITTVRDGCGPTQWRCFKRDTRGMVCDTCNWDWNYTCSRCEKPKR